MPHPQPPDLERAAVEETIWAIVDRASRAADLVVSYLDAIGIRGKPENPVPVPAWLLADLGSALQLLVWERAGVAGRLGEVFPPAQGLLHDIFRAARDSAAAAGRQPDLALARRIIAGHLRYLAHDRSPFDADVVIGDPDDDVLVDALTQFLWTTRTTPAPD